MSNSKMIGRCETCGQDYCQECTDAEAWAKYCSTQCEADSDDDSPKTPEDLELDKADHKLDIEKGDLK